MAGEPAVVHGVVVTYEPDAGVVGRVASVLPQLAGLVVVDNGSRSSESLAALDALESMPGLSLQRNDENEGLAAGLNRGLRRTVRDGADWSLLLDQDSEPLPALVEGLLRVTRRHPRVERLAVVGTNYLEPSGRPHAALDAGAWASVPSVITSGSIVASPVIERIGPMREGLFIDYVDHEFCLRARAAGYEVAISGECGLRHGIGRVTRHRIGPLAGGASHHAPARRYYRTRNQLLVYRRFGWREPGWLAHDAWQAAKSTAQMCLFERERPAKLGAMVAGVRDALLGREGRSRRW